MACLKAAEDSSSGFPREWASQPGPSEVRLTPVAASFALAYPVEIQAKSAPKLP